MKYPSIEEVKKADVQTLARWTRFLPSPGASLAGKLDRIGITGLEMAIMDLIIYRFNEAGGMTPELSKQLGWVKS